MWLIDILCILHWNCIETSQRCRVDENRCVFRARMKVFCDSSGARSEMNVENKLCVYLLIIIIMSW